MNDEENTDERPSKSQRKRDVHALQDLGTELVDLNADQLAQFNLPERLVEAITEAQRISNFEGRRRQMQFIGKLMRKLDPAELDSVRAALAEQHGGSVSETLALHQAEQWRDGLIGDDAAFEKWLVQYPLTDGQQLRALIRQTRKDAVPGKPGETPRHGKAYRDLFQLVREQINRIPDNEPEPHARDTTQF